jgi:hypothetical protein
MLAENKITLSVRMEELKVNPSSALNYFATSRLKTSRIISASVSSLVRRDAPSISKLPYYGKSGNSAISGSLLSAECGCFESDTTLPRRLPSNRNVAW